MASFTDQQPRVATEKDCQTKWSGDPANFRCYMCGHKFEVGDIWRFVYAGDRGAINPLICKVCDGPDVLDRWVAHYRHAESAYWWLMRD
jgi:hypothetical protein